MKNLRLSLLCLVLPMFISCGSDNTVKDVAGEWFLVGENCDNVGVCERKVEKLSWTFDRQSEDGKVIIFTTKSSKPFLFKGNRIIVKAAQVVPVEDIILIRDFMLIERKKNSYLRLERLDSE